MIDGRSIHRHLRLSIGEAAKAMAGLELSDRDMMIADRVVKEINARLSLPARRRPRLLSASAARPRHCPVARPSESGWPARSDRVLSECCTCWTSRRSACISATTPS